jgi:para-nitrobenzyl esterase
LKAGGVAHTIEHAFLFPGRYQPTKTEALVQHQMVGYWTRMARTGNPNGGDGPTWPTVTADNGAFLAIGANTAASSGPPEAKCDFWDTISFPSPHL